MRFLGSGQRQVYLISTKFGLTENGVQSLLSRFTSTYADIQSKLMHRFKVCRIVDLSIFVLGLCLGQMNLRSEACFQK